jgi:prepilin-type N-terminal cleavage/methylation domain-containing protein
MKKQAGFTLVEIALVMVVVGLLLSGILKGREIITNAKIKLLERDYQAIATALASYQDRYRALPGDDKRATRRFASNMLPPHISQIFNGDGNWHIEGAFDDDSQTLDQTKESRHFWSHLRLSGLIAGEPGSSELPQHVFGGVTGVSSQSNTSGRTPVTISNTFVGFTNIPNAAAIILESRCDDNRPHQGHIQTEEFNYQNHAMVHKIYFEL